jgi:hypothetical protein
MDPKTVMAPNDLYRLRRVIDQRIPAVLVRCSFAPVRPAVHLVGSPGAIFGQ